MSKITKHKKELQLSEKEHENIIFSNVSQIIEKRKFNAVSAANSQVILMFWEIGTYINSVILGMERAEYGKKILSTVSTKLVAKKERIERRKLLKIPNVQKQINYFLEESSDETDDND